VYVILERTLRCVLMHGHREPKRAHDPTIEDGLRHNAGLPLEVDPILMAHSRKDLAGPAPRFTGLPGDAIFGNPVRDAQAHRFDGFSDRAMTGFGCAFRCQAGPDRKSQMWVAGQEIGDHCRIARQTSAEAELLRDPIKARDPITFRWTDDAMNPRRQGKKVD
jgi:hypothetical protein